MRQTPDALPDDGLFDITVIREAGRIEIIRSLPIIVRWNDYEPSKG
jgi:diacylglycerol kinase family enzyme